MDNVIELANEIRAGVEDVAIKAQQRIVELETDCAYYKSEAERHNASANDLAQRLAHWIEKHDKETLPRADLEADLAATRDLAEGYAQERNELKEENAKLLDALDTAITVIEEYQAASIRQGFPSPELKKLREARGEK